MLAVYAGRRCNGFIFNRGRDGTEAFDADGKSIGLFSNQHDAVGAISFNSNRGRRA
jgi:hypothetical protein